MTLLNDDSLPITYNNPSQIIKDFCKIRLSYYCKRKSRLLQDMSNKRDKLTQEELFISKVLEKTITFENMEKDLIDDIDLYPINDSYDHFLNLPVKSLTASKVLKLKNNILEIKNSIVALESKTAVDIWIEDLEMLKKSLMSQ